MATKQHVLFLCTGNSARSQMAEGILRDLAGDTFEVFSAGTQPKGLHPKTVKVMKEIGIDVTNQRSKPVSEFGEREFDYVITLCDRARQDCPTFPGAEPLHWGFDDPADAPPDRQDRMFRQVRDEVLARLRLFVSVNKAQTMT